MSLDQSFGWICIHRKLGDHPYYGDSQFVHLWVDLLIHATHREIRMRFAGKIIVLKPGQLITSRALICRRTGIERSKCERLLTVMKSEHQIEQQTSNTSRLITIVNWIEYQVSEQQIEQRMSSKRAASEQRVSSEPSGTSLNNNVTMKQLNKGEGASGMSKAHGINGSPLSVLDLKDVMEAKQRKLERLRGDPATLTERKELREEIKNLNDQLANRA